MKILQASANSSLLQNDGDDDDNGDGEYPLSRFQFIAPSLIHAGDSGSDGEYDVVLVMNYESQCNANCDVKDDVSGDLCDPPHSSHSQLFAD